jgi:hypothetical protein
MFEVQTAQVDALSDGDAFLYFPSRCSGIRRVIAQRNQQPPVEMMAWAHSTCRDRKAFSVSSCTNPKSSLISIASGSVLEIREAPRVQSLVSDTVYFYRFLCVILSGTDGRVTTSHHAVCIRICFV